MTALQTALAELVATEARIHELVDPDLLRVALSNLAKRCAVDIELAHTRISVLEEQMRQWDAFLHKAITEGVHGAPSIPVKVVEEGLDALEGAHVEVLDDGMKHLDAPDIAATFGFDKPGE